MISYIDISYDIFIYALCSINMYIDIVYYSEMYRGGGVSKLQSPKVQTPLMDIDALALLLFSASEPSPKPIFFLFYTIFYPLRSK